MAISANETAKALRAFDDKLELVVCGSSHSEMPSYPQWEATVLEETYDQIDYISLHMYFENYEKKHGGISRAAREKLDRYIGTVGGVIDFIRARSARSATSRSLSMSGTSGITTQERCRAHEGLGLAARTGSLEDIYNFEDVLQVGCIINTFIRRSIVCASPASHSSSTSSRRS